MLRRKRPIEVPPEEAPPQTPPEMPLMVEPDPIVRAVLVGPAGQAQRRLFDLISAQRGMEVFARFERADQALVTLYDIPTRRRAAVIIDARLPGLHGAGWLIRRLRERHPVLRLFAYSEDADLTTMELAALAGVD